MLSKVCSGFTPHLLENPLYKKLDRIITVNHLHHRINALGQQLIWTGSSLLLPSAQERIPWELVKQYPCSGGYSFLFRNRELFRTDSSYRLHPEFTYNYRGFVREEFQPFQERNPAEWRFKYVLEVWTALRDQEYGFPSQGDHAYLILKDPFGHVYGLGRAVERLALEIPDRYCLFDQRKRDFKKTEIPLTEAKYRRILNYLKEEHRAFSAAFKHAKPGSSFALLCGKNCSALVEDVLAQAGIKMKSELSVPEFLFKRFCPRFLKPCFVLFPCLLLSYFLTLFYGVLCLTLNRLLLPEKWRKEIPLVDLLFRPWRIGIHHPVAIRRWQKPILETTCV